MAADQFTSPHVDEELGGPVEGLVTTQILSLSTQVSRRGRVCADEKLEKSELL